MGCASPVDGGAKTQLTIEAFANKRTKDELRWGMLTSPLILALYALDPEYLGVDMEKLSSDDD